MPSKRIGDGYQGVYQQPFTPMNGQNHMGVDLPGTVYTLNVPKGAVNVMVQCHTQNVYYTLDGSTPSATNGFLMVANAVPIIIELTNNVTVRFIEAAGGAILNYQYGE